jgi:hypothetical protein
MPRIRRVLSFHVLLLLAFPGVARAQCEMDLVEAGVQAYRDLELDAATDLLNGAVSVNASSPCSATDARALTYLGAAHWLAERPDAATRAFTQAVIRAPRFRPDAFEFPPEVTALFDEVRRSTPSVAATLPDYVAIGPDAEETLFIRLAASTDHTVEVVVRDDGLPVQTIYRGPVVAGPRGTLVEWNGRGFGGELVSTGWYDLEIVSMDEQARPLRKVVVVLTVESDAPVEPEPPTEPAALDTAAVQALTPRPPSLWKAVAVGGAGLLGGALVLAGPSALEGGQGTWARYPVAGSLGVAGIIGFVRHLRGGSVETAFSTDGPDEASPLVETSRAAPTLRIRPGYQRRVELDRRTTAAGERRRGPGAP